MHFRLNFELINNTCLETVGGLVLDPVLEDEAQNSCGHLEEQQDCEEDGVGCQQRRVLPQRPHAPAGRADEITACFSRKVCTPLLPSASPSLPCEPNDEGDGAGPDEDEGRVERDVGHEREVVERVLLRPRPHADGQDA